MTSKDSSSTSLELSRSCPAQVYRSNKFQLFQKWTSEIQNFWMQIVLREKRNDIQWRLRIMQMKRSIHCMKQSASEKICCWNSPAPSAKNNLCSARDFSVELDTILAQKWGTHYIKKRIFTSKSTSGLSLCTPLPF